MNVPSYAPNPSWIKIHPILLSPDSPSFGPLYHLLDDQQINISEECSFHHKAYKIVNENGLQNELTIPFHHAFEKLSIHTFQIIRNNQILDKTNTPIKLSPSKDYLIAHLPLDNLQIGDIIQYSYSTKGFNPLHKDHFSHLFPLEYPYPLQKKILRVVSNNPKQFLYRCHNKKVPVLINWENQALEWEWSQDKISAAKDETNPPFLEITDYSNWSDVVENQLKNFPKPTIQSLPLQMKLLANTWKTESPSKERQALSALRFVQDRIRSEEMIAYQHIDPSIIFERRFGNNKDKIQLLRSFLALSDIESDPVLVSTKNGKKLPDYFPSPHLFDHAILRIKIGDSFYWVDPTTLFEGGPLSTTTNESYTHGLILTEGQSHLTPLPEPTKNKIESLLSATLESPDSPRALVMLITDFYHQEANGIRRYYKSTSKEDISNQCLECMKKFYGSAKLLKPIQIEDDRDLNHIQFVETYSIDDFIDFNPEKGEKSFEVRPYYLHPTIYRYISPDQTSLTQKFPTQIEETVSISQQWGKWNKEKQNQRVEDPAFDFKTSFEIDQEIAKYSFVYESKSDSISPEKLSNYKKNLDHAQEISLWRVKLPEVSKEEKPYFSTEPIIIIAVSTILITFLIKKFKKITNS